MAALLLVDGDRNFRCAMEIALRLEGFEVTCVAEAADALTLLADRRFDLVAVDTLVPSADRLLAEAAAAGQRAVATGRYPELLERAARRHLISTLEKPFSADELVAPIAAAGGAGA